ncbi:dicarboxylate/amino acid:cation symporter [Thalassotalea sp. PS06]|uniref:dicarboxylate/amino acid:cation symporter n=1 Tax=Thalassotalea sp. PS06 TaxID=2594005 RepID=UPI001163B761|nr:dicarboxylate/amino acid:cation symporter [Thalassotalea sp. PS06]QDP00270.1 dicarboxylate/amino acid:cation symporter [Thalassotalea sp. PS06]
MCRQTALTYKKQQCRIRNMSEIQQTTPSKFRQQLWFKVLIALILGFAVGTLFSENLALIDSATAKSIGQWLALPGTIFMMLLKFIVLPLVLSSVILGIASSNDVRAIKTLGFGVIYILLTSTIAIALAFLLAGWIQPGAVMNSDYLGSLTNPDMKQLDLTENGLIGIITGIFPNNVFSHLSKNQMLQVVVAAIIFGFGLLHMDRKSARPLLELMESVQSLCMTIVLWLMKYTPIVVFGLIANVIITKGLGAISAVSMFFANVLIGLLCIIALYLVLVALVANKSPMTFLKNCREVMALALATSSSSATMPVTLRVTETLHGVKPQVSRLIVPLGTTINMDATAMYQATVVLFIAQAFGIDLTNTQMVTIVLLSLVASIGAPGIPSSSLPILAGTLASQGLPVEGMALILGVDRLLDMGRSVVNVTGDMTAATVMNRFINDDSAVPNKKT